MARRAGFYERRVFPWLNDKLTASPELLQLRTESLSAARGRVIEIGFGSGANLAHYPQAVEAIVAIEPNEGMRRRAEVRTGAFRFPVEVLTGKAENLPLLDRSFDTAVSILTLCSVMDPARALLELHRVLRDDGRLILLEHGLSEEAGVARWQNRLNGIQKVLGCGCHLNRPIAELVEGHGFRFETLRRFYAPRTPRTHGWISAGMAVKAQAASGPAPSQ